MDNTSNYVAIDVEMVPTPYGQEPTQVAVVNYDGDIIYESYVTPRGVPKSAFVLRGITRKANVAKPYDVVRSELISLLKGKVIIGHDLQHDMHSFDLLMDDYTTIDTAKHPVFTMLTTKSRKLKNLSKNVLKRNIQTGKHNASEDAIATMNIVKQLQPYLNEDVPLVKKNINLAKKIVNTAKRLHINSYSGGKSSKLKLKRTRRKQRLV